MANMVEGGWYNGRQYWGGTLGPVGVINPQSNQVGAGQAVSKQVVAQTNPNNVSYIANGGVSPTYKPTPVKTPTYTPFTKPSTPSYASAAPSYYTSAQGPQNSPLSSMLGLGGKTLTPQQRLTQTTQGLQQFATVTIKNKKTGEVKTVPQSQYGKTTSTLPTNFANPTPSKTNKNTNQTMVSVMFVHKKPQTTIQKPVVPTFNPEQQKNADLIKQALINEGIYTPKVYAYALATAQHEAGLIPKDEIRGRSGTRLSELQNLYGGGWQYHGRGLIQLTHAGNYEAMGQRIGLGDALVKNPELANQPDIAARIMAAFMKDRGVAQRADQGDFVGARGPINGTDKAQSIANTARQYLQYITTQQPVAPVSTFSPMGSASSMVIEKPLVPSYFTQ